MKKSIILLCCAAIAMFTACGSRVDDKSTKGGSFNGQPNGEPNNMESNTPNGMTGSNNDNIAIDPVKCGDGTLDPGELCDPGITDGGGACPTSCAAGACATAELIGSADMCTAHCAVEPVACIDADGCCPDGCSADMDSDCGGPCVPTTCANAGAQCGQIADGCGATLSCQDTCGVNETCQANLCVSGPGPSIEIGKNCLDYPDCDSPEMIAVCLLDPTWPGGHCSEICNDPQNPDGCPLGSHCAEFPEFDLCLLDCNDSTDCDPGYVCRQMDGGGPNECGPPEPDGNGSLGDPCNSDADCNAATPTCLQTIQAQGATITFPGGSCSSACTPLIGMECPVGGACSIFGQCMPACTIDAECRVGYSCFDPGLGFKSCWPT